MIPSTGIDAVGHQPLRSLFTPLHLFDCLCGLKIQRVMSLLIKSFLGFVFFFDRFPRIYGVQWWTVSLNESGYNTTPTTIAYESFRFSLWLSVSPSHYFAVLLSLSLSHTHNHAVQMNAHTNVTDCKTVTHTEQRLEKRMLSHFFLSPSKVWRFLEFCLGVHRRAGGSGIVVTVCWMISAESIG